MSEIASNPFTPKSGWEPKVFLGRENEIGFFKQKLEEVKQGRCDHFLVLGDWGIGKTSLLKEFKMIAQGENILSAMVPIREFQEGDGFILATQHLATQIPRKLPVKYKGLKHYARYLKGFGISIGGVGGFTLPSADAKLGGDPQVVLLDSLVALWNDLKRETKIVLVLLDDVQNYKPISGFLTILKNVLSDEEVVDTGFLFILSCTPNDWKQFLVRHHPVGRYFTPRLILHNLSEDDVSGILSGLLANTGITFEQTIIRRVYEYTRGHPYELQLLCSNLYDNQIGGRVAEAVWDASLTVTLNELGEIVFDTMYGKASYNERRILHLLSLLDKPLTPQEVVDFSFEKGVDISATVVKTGLQRLFKKGLLIKSNKFKYALLDRMFREYIHRLGGIQDIQK